MRKFKSVYPEDEKKQKSYEEIQNIRESFGIKDTGDNFNQIYNKFIDDPSLLSLKNDIASNAALAEILLKDLENKEYSGPKKLALVAAVANVNRNNGILKEKYIRLKAVYDMATIKAVISQAFHILSDIRSSVVEIENFNKEDVLKIIEKGLETMENYKVPIISGGKDAN